MLSARIQLRILSGLAFAGVAIAAPACAEDFKLGENPASVILKWRPTTPDPEVKDFVKESRPAGELKYAPLSGPKVDRPPLKSKKELKDTVDDMDKRAATLHRRGAAAAAAGGNATAQQLQAAGAESRRRAAEAFGSSK